MNTGFWTITVRKISNWLIHNIHTIIQRGW
jgi:hypothetical protein